MGYLVCNKCGGYYMLRAGESPDDFKSKCECGGRLEYFKRLSDPLNKSQTSSRESSDKTWNKYFIPLMLIMVGIESIISIFYTLSINIILGILSILFGIIFILIRRKNFERIFYPKIRSIIYFSAAVLFLVQSGALSILWFQINYDSSAKIGISIFIILSLICGLSMILKTIDPDNHRNKLDPPLYS